MINNMVRDCLQDARALFRLERLDISLPTDREDDNDDYLKIFGDLCLSKPFINIGSGNWRHSFWTNLDYAVPPYHLYGEPDINVDLSKMVEFPFEDNFIFLAYCSHVLEHLTDEVVCNVISQVYRILRPGGVFRIIVPDLYTAYCAYFLNDFRYYDHRSQCRQKNKSIVYVTSSGHLKGRSIGESFVQRIASALGHISEFDSLPLDLFLQKSIHSSSPEQIAISLLNTANFENKLPHQHINYFTFDKFLSLLSDVGFRLVLRSSYGQSLIPLMRNKVYFDQTRPNESLWVEAIK